MTFDGITPQLSCSPRVVPHWVRFRIKVRFRIGYGSAYRDIYVYGTGYVKLALSVTGERIIG